MMRPTSPPPGPVSRRWMRPRVCIVGSAIGRRAPSCKRRTKRSSRRSIPVEFSARKRLTTSTGVGHFGFQPSSRRAFSADISMPTSVRRSQAGSSASDRPSFCASAPSCARPLMMRLRHAHEAQVARRRQLAPGRRRLGGDVEGAARVLAKRQRHRLGDVLVPHQRQRRRHVDDGAARRAWRRARAPSARQSRSTGRSRAMATSGCARLERRRATPRPPTSPPSRETTADARAASLRRSAADGRGRRRTPPPTRCRRSA